MVVELTACDVCVAKPSRTEVLGGFGGRRADERTSGRLDERMPGRTGGWTRGRIGGRTSGQERTGGGAASRAS